jgi:hypothetical protein
MPLGISPVIWPWAKMSATVSGLGEVCAARVVEAKMRPRASEAKTTGFGDKEKSSGKGPARDSKWAGNNAGFQQKV